MQEERQWSTPDNMHERRLCTCSVAHCLFTHINLGPCCRAQAVQKACKAVK